ncbi:hypothetical protein [Streptomyces sp. NPDC093795]
MGGDLSQRLVPDDLWAMIEPVLPSFRGGLDWSSVIADAASVRAKGVR